MSWHMIHLKSGLAGTNAAHLSSMPVTPRSRRAEGLEPRGSRQYSKSLSQTAKKGNRGWRGNTGQSGNIASEIASQQGRVPACNWLSQGLSVSHAEAVAWFPSSEPGLLDCLNPPCFPGFLHTSATQSYTFHLAESVCDTPSHFSITPTLFTETVVTAPGLHICINFPLLFLVPVDHKVLPRAGLYWDHLTFSLSYSPISPFLVSLRSP